MKEKIHPQYKPLQINIGKESFPTYSTYHGSEYFMDIDYRKHPAWTRSGSTELNQSNKNINDFNKKFAGISFGAVKK